jgi:hypothetical protein
MMRKLDISNAHPPFGASATRFADGARLVLTTRSGEQVGADLSRAAAEALRDELNAALAPGETG